MGSWTLTSTRQRWECESQWEASLPPSVGEDGPTRSQGPRFTSEQNTKGNKIDLSPTNTTSSVSSGTWGPCWPVFARGGSRACLVHSAPSSSPFLSHTPVNLLGHLDGGASTRRLFPYLEYPSHQMTVQLQWERVEGGGQCRSVL